MSEETEELSDLDKKINEVSSDLGVELEAHKREEKKQEIMGKGASAGVEFSAAVVICTLIGVGLDKHFGTKPLWLLLFMGLGCVVAFYNLYKASQEL